MTSLRSTEQKGQLPSESPHHLVGEACIQSFIPFVLKVHCTVPRQGGRPFGNTVQTINKAQPSLQVAEEMPPERAERSTQTTRQPGAAAPTSHLVYLEHLPRAFLLLTSDEYTDTSSPSPQPEGGQRGALALCGHC